MKGINEIVVDKEQTVAEWLTQWTVSNFTARQFLDLKVLSAKAVTIGGVTFPSKTVTNFDRIIQQYTNEEYRNVQGQSALGGTVIIKSGTTVGMPNYAIKRQFVQPSITPSLVELSNLKPFMAAALKDLYSDPNYIKETRDLSGQQQVTTQINDISVYIWIRSITNPGNNSQDGAWYDVSACVESVSTFVGPQGGSFTINFMPAHTIYDQIGWSLSNVRGYESGSVREDVVGINTISKYRAKEDNFLARNDFFFSRALQENDLVYIRFEGLESERMSKLWAKNKQWQGRAFGGSDVPGQIYDLIGLVDTVQESGSQNNVGISVGGRDFMKVLIEDGSTFFPEQAGAQIFSDPDSVLARRNLLANEFGHDTALRSATSFKFIPSVLKFIFNQFSNIGMVPSHVFNGYGSRIEKKKFNITSGNATVDEINRLTGEERQGVWTIIDFLFDSSVSQRVVSDTGISTDSGSIINSINKVCQEPFIEFDGDTYGDKYYFVARKRPFDAIGYRGMVYDNVEVEDAADGVNSLGDITKLKNRLRSSVNKTINTFVNKAPTFTKFKEKLAREARKRNILNGRPSLISDLVIDIDEADVIQDNLSYSNEAYSWYRLIPRNIGIDVGFASFTLAPAIPFDEYAEIWGNKSYELESNYIPGEFIDDSLLEKKLKYVESQTFLDLRFIIQSNAYLPFTRQGTIIINGDRRIKKNTMIYYKPTDEIFLVESVGNQRTLNDRYTTLQVSRGMREKYIKGVMVPFGLKSEKVSYFDIINLELPNSASIDKTEFLKNWRVNRNVFNFFLQRRQWVD